MEGQESQRQEMAAEQLKSQQQAAMQAAVPPASNAGTANGEASHESPLRNKPSTTCSRLLWLSACWQAAMPAVAYPLSKADAALGRVKYVRG